MKIILMHQIINTHYIVIYKIFKEIMILIPSLLIIKIYLLVNRIVFKNKTVFNLYKIINFK
jgi:hypothetical protein